MIFGLLKAFVRTSAAVGATVAIAAPEPSPPPATSDRTPAVPVCARLPRLSAKIPY